MLDVEKINEWLDTVRLFQKEETLWYELSEDDSYDTTSLEESLQNLSDKRDELQPFTFYTSARGSTTLIFEGNEQQAIILAEENNIDLNSMSCSCCGGDWWMGETDYLFDLNLSNEENVKKVRDFLKEDSWKAKGNTSNVEIFYS